MGSGPTGSGDQVTDERARAGVLTDLVIGWDDILEVFDDEITLRTLQRWDAQGLLPILSYGPRKVAAYRDRLIAALLTLRVRAGSRGRVRPVAVAA